MGEQYPICDVFPAPFAVFLNEDDKTYVEPDISVICDPDKNRITVYNFETEDMAEYTFADSVKAGIYEDLSINFGQLDI